MWITLTDTGGTKMVVNMDRVKCVRDANDGTSTVLISDKWYFRVRVSIDAIQKIMSSRDFTKGEK